MTNTDEPWIVALANQKGGVGKTTITMGLSSVTAEAAAATLAVDIDPQQSTQELTGRLKEPGYEVVTENDPAALAQVRRLRGLDVIYVDCPGSLEGRDTLDRVIEEADYVVVPYNNDDGCRTPTLRTVRYAEERGVPVKVLLNNIDPRLGAAEVDDAWEWFGEHGIRHFRAFVRQYRAYPASVKAGLPITRWKGKNASPAREDLRRVHAEMLTDFGRLSRNQEVA